MFPFWERLGMNDGSKKKIIYTHTYYINKERTIHIDLLQYTCNKIDVTAFLPTYVRPKSDSQRPLN